MAGLPLSSGVRCSSCRTERRGTEALVGTVVMLMWVLLSLRYGLTARGFLLAIVATALVTLAVIDLHHLILPDILTLPGTVIGVVASGLPNWPVSFLDATLSAALGYFCMMGLAKAAEAYYGDEAIGQGDWKLVAMLGAVFGSTKLLLIVVAANAIGAAVGLVLIATKGAEGRQKLPLGSFLGVCGLLASLL
jgi:leader peptidase (prepilin peptidase)/N-methyltransferase